MVISVCDKCTSCGKEAIEPEFLYRTRHIAPRDEAAKPFGEVILHGEAFLWKHKQASKQALCTTVHKPKFSASLKMETALGKQWCVKLISES